MKKMADIRGLGKSQFLRVRSFVFLIPLLLVGLLAGQPATLSSGVVAQSPSARQRSAARFGPETSASKPTDAALLEQTRKKLLISAGRHKAEHSEYIDQYVWPPKITIDQNVEVNAYAYIERNKNNGEPIRDRATRKFLPHVGMTQPMMNQIVRSTYHRLAFIMGHELAHLLLGHVLDTSAARAAPTATLAVIFTADQEHDADVLGMQLALEAGYSISGAREVWEIINGSEFTLKNPGWNFTSFEGRSETHPAWSDRLALIDKEKATLWRAMSAFENGVYFLTAQQYPTAEENFEVVTKDFPSSYEAWANLGYARLLMYFDEFNVDDLAYFNIGQIAVGSFYFRPDSMRPLVKGVNEQIWMKAKTALETSLRVRPSLTLAEANLGLIYLFNPDRQDAQKDVQTAIQHLEAAVKQLPSDRTISNINRIAVLNNSAVALMAGGQTELANARLAEARNLRLDGDEKTNTRVMAVNDESFPAIAYNQALFLCKSKNLDDKKEGALKMSSYLEGMSPASLWWELAYAHYAVTRKELGVNYPTKEQMRRTAMSRRTLRQVTSVELPGGALVTLAEPVERVRLKLGKSGESPDIKSPSLKRLSYPQYGLEMLATRRVIAIILKGSTDTTLNVRDKGTGSALFRLRPGMDWASVKSVLGENYIQDCLLADWEVKYSFFPEIGVAVRLNGDRASEFVVTQIVVKAMKAISD